jgi:hypothetical protein
LIYDGASKMYCRKLVTSISVWSITTDSGTLTHVPRI